MKNLLMLVVALLMTTTIAFAAQSTQTPKEKGKEFAHQIIKAVIEDNLDDVGTIGLEMGNYAATLTEAQVEGFLEGFHDGIYYYCDYYGLGEEAADAFLTNFYAAIFSELAKQYE